jgi:hypothetical protein
MLEGLSYPQTLRTILLMLINFFGNIQRQEAVVVMNVIVNFLSL